MSEEATQPATQLVMDPRRYGHPSSDMSEEDLSDIFCILHPASMAACKAAANIAEEYPQFTMKPNSAPVKPHAETVKGNAPSPGTFELAAEGITSCDLVLRFSAKVKDPLQGFQFGRHAPRCDFVIGDDDEKKRMSSVHFRIFINEHGIIMIEDSSTNGTVVEGRLLRAKSGDPRGSKHVLESGSIINIVMVPKENSYQFIVRIPQRDGVYEDQYDQNLNDHLERRNFLQQQRQRTEAVGNVRGKNAYGGEAPDLFGKTLDKPSATSSGSELIRRHKQWKGGAKYNKIGVAGKGAFANVYKITDKFDGTPYAAKELEKRRFMKNGVLDQKVENEIKIMSRLKHKYIVQYIEHVDWNEYLYLILEFVPYGDLGELVARYKKLEEPTVKLMASQLLSALQYLHAQGVTHRDVKPDNILIHSKMPFHVKLTDFGLSKLVEGGDGTVLRTFCGTLLYCAPEVYSEYREYDDNGKRNLRGKKPLPPQEYDQAVDLWSLAGVLFYSLCGIPPYPASNGVSYQELLHMIMSKPLDIAPLQKTGVSKDGIQVIQSMLNIRPELRPAIEELQRSSWLVEDEDTNSLDAYDEIDLVGHDNDDEDLQRGASQLSLVAKTDSPNGERNGDSENIDMRSVRSEPDLEVPSSIQSGASTSSDSFTFLQNPTPQPRLFGEIAASAIGSSGVLPSSQLNLPASQFEDDFDSSVENYPGYHQDPTITITGDSAPDLHAPNIRDWAQAQPKAPGQLSIGGVLPAISLLGTDSLVGHMQIDSPSPGKSSSSSAAETSLATNNTHQLGDQMQPGNPLGPPLIVGNGHLSIRRTHDEYTRDLDATTQLDPKSAAFYYDGTTGAEIASVRHRAVSGEPTTKRAMTSRHLSEMDEVPQAAFWSPTNPFTWHRDYPPLSMAEFKERQQQADQRGQKSYFGDTPYPAIVKSYRVSRSPSLEPDPSFRAVSEPTQDGPRLGLIREGRKLGDIFTKDGGAPRAVAGFVNDPMSRIGQDQLRYHDEKPILATLSSTVDSATPQFSIKITELVTTWGRAGNNTLVYPRHKDVKVPKYALRLVLWKPKINPAAPLREQMDCKFYISTKASCGISINDVELRAHDPKNYATPSQQWGELKDNDKITIWKVANPVQVNRLHFRCWFGMSQSSRMLNDKFRILPLGEKQAQIDDFCIEQASKVLGSREIDTDAEETEGKGKAKAMQD